MIFKTPNNIVACKYERAFSCEKKMVVGHEEVGERREEEILRDVAQ